MDKRNSNATLGGEIQNGKLIKSADAGGRRHVDVSNDGTAQLVDLTVDTAANFAGADRQGRVDQRVERRRGPRGRHGRLHPRLGDLQPQPSQRVAEKTGLPFECAAVSRSGLAVRVHAASL